MEESSPPSSVDVTHADVTHAVIPTARQKPLPGASNPLRRLRAQLGVTQDVLAKRCGVTRQFVLRAEQAVYTEPPVGILNHLLDELRYELSFEDFQEDRDSLIAEYHAFQRAVRKSNFGTLIQSRVVFDLLDTNPTWLTHPFVWWREYSGVHSRIAMSKYFCVHPAVMFKFEAQTHLMQGVPEDLRKALEDSGYDKELLDSLDKAYENYKKNLRSKVTAVTDINTSNPSES